jgi:hypothetical protein
LFGAGALLVAPLRAALLLALLALPIAGGAQPRIGVIEYGNETSPGVITYLEALRELGYAEPRSLAIERRFAQARPERFAELVDELVRARVKVIFTQDHDIPQVAKRIAPGTSIVTAGSLLAYGADILDLMRRAAAQTDKILKGAKAGELPVEQASRFVLVVNLKTAKALGVTIPQSVLLRADEVIQ